MGYVLGRIRNRGFCYTGMLRIQRNLKVGPYLLGCIWAIPGILIFSGMMGAVPDLNPANEMLSQYVKQKQFYNMQNTEGFRKRAGRNVSKKFSTFPYIFLLGSKSFCRICTR